jgi:hypothetical protein
MYTCKEGLEIRIRTLIEWLSTDFVPLKNFSLRRQHCQWMAATFSFLKVNALRSELIGFELEGVLIVSHLLRHGHYIFCVSSEGPYIGPPPLKKKPWICLCFRVNNSKRNGKQTILNQLRHAILHISYEVYWMQCITLTKIERLISNTKCNSYRSWQRGPKEPSAQRRRDVFRSQIVFVWIF